MKGTIKKKALALIMAGAMISSYSIPSGMGFVYAAEGTMSGEGTVESPFIVEDAADFAAMSADGIYKLANDITITASYGNAFSGTFDGDGHSVTLKGTDSESAAGGVFSSIAVGGTIKNVTVKGSVNSTGNAGGLVDTAAGGTIEKCINEAYVSSESRRARLGGIVGSSTGGSNDLSVTECGNRGNITGTGSSSYAAGIAGYFAGNGNVTKCYNTGDISAQSRAAGILGQTGSSNRIEKVYNAGAVSGNATVAALIGWCNATLVDGYYVKYDGAKVTGNEPGTAPTNCEMVDDASALLEKVKDFGFVADNGKINKGYPVLSWEAKSAEPDAADVAIAEAIKAKYDGEMGVLRPAYGTDTNICTVVKSKMDGYTDIAGFDASKLSVELKSSADNEIIAADGTINYIKANQWTMAGLYSKNIDCVFTVTYGSATVDTGSRRATVGWDREYFSGKMQEEADTLTADSIKGDNQSLDSVESNLVLPQCMGKSAKEVWSEISWESSNEERIHFESEPYSGITTPLKGVITPGETDEEVTLTATFKANESILNSFIEKVGDFKTITKTFKVNVKGTGVKVPTEDELKEILTKYYTVDLIKMFDTGAVADLSNCTGDLQLPRYTKIKDEEGNLVFENKEITVTSDNDKVIAINGYRATVDRVLDKDTVVNLKVTLTRKEVSGTITIPVTVKAIPEADIDSEIIKMETAKKHFFDGLNNGKYADANSVTGNLSAFKEINVNGNNEISWVYNVNDMTNNGIVPTGFFDDPWQMEAAGFNLFKSSNNAILSHENLVCVRPERDTVVTITAWLSSSKFAEMAKKHPENEKLQKLYKQEVSVDVTVKGTVEIIDSVTLNKTAYTYDGSKRVPTATVKNNAGNTLTKDTDYTVTVKDGSGAVVESPVNVGTYTVVVEGKGSYAGTVEKTYVIDPANIDSISVKGSPFTYNGKNQTPDPTVYNVMYDRLTKDTDYIVKVKNSEGNIVAEAVNVGKYTVVVEGIGNYKGTKEKAFEIKSAALGDDSVKLSKTAYLYDGSKHIPSVTVKGNDGKELSQDADFTVTVKDGNGAVVESPVNVGTYTVVVEGKGSYEGTVEKTYVIDPAVIDVVSIKGSPFTYNGENQMPELSVYDVMYDKLTKDTDYTVTVKDSEGNVVTEAVNAGTYTVVVEGLGNYKGVKEKTFEIKKSALSDDNSALKETSFTYNGKSQIPEEIVKDSALNHLEKDTDYTVTVKDSEGNVVTEAVNAGTYTVVIEGIGNFEGSLEKTFKINKAKQSIKVSSKSLTKYASYKSLKKKAVYTSKVTVLSAETKVTYAKVSGSSKLKIGKTSGKIYVKKGTKKGVYKIKIKVTAAEGNNYAKAVKTTTIKVRVK